VFDKYTLSAQELEEKMAALRQHLRRDVGDREREEARKEAENSPLAKLRGVGIKDSIFLRTSTGDSSIDTLAHTSIVVSNSIAPNTQRTQRQSPRIKINNIFI
jgi:hypothetical protein